MEEKKSHIDLLKEFYETVAREDDEMKYVRTMEYYKPISVYLIASELAIANDYLKRIVEALENERD